MSAAPIGSDAGLHGDQAASVRTLADDASRVVRRLRAEVDGNPFVAVVASACLGFALGGGIPRGVITVLLGVGVRAAGSRLGEAMIERAPTFRTAQEDLE